MDYFLLKVAGDRYQNINFIEKNPFVGHHPSYDAAWKWKLLEGKLINTDDVHFVEIFHDTESEPKPDFYFVDGLRIIINEKVKKILEPKLNSNICQFVPLLLLNTKYEIVENVYMINPLIIIDCISRKYSKYKKKGVLDFIVEPVLNRKKVPNLPIFLVLENPRLVIINQDIYELLKDHKFTGLKTIKLELKTDN